VLLPVIPTTSPFLARDVTAIIAVLHLGAALPAATLPFVGPGPTVPAVFAIDRPAAT
jgi:hypothetical protein